MPTTIDLSLYDLCCISVRLDLAISNLQQIIEKANNINDLLTNNLLYQPHIEITLKNPTEPITTRIKLLSLQTTQYEISEGKSDLQAIEKYVKSYCLYENLPELKIPTSRNEWWEQIQKIQDQIQKNSTDPILHSYTIPVTVHQ